MLLGAASLFYLTYLTSSLGFIFLSYLPTYPAIMAIYKHISAEKKRVLGGFSFFLHVAWNKTKEMASLLYIIESTAWLYVTTWHI